MSFSDDNLHGRWANAKDEKDYLNLICMLLMEIREQQNAILEEIRKVRETGA
jgi:hypothetical protein